MRDVNARFGYAEFNTEAPVGANRCCCGCLFLYKFIRCISLDFLGFGIFEKPFFLTRQEKKKIQHLTLCKVLWSWDFPTSPCRIPANAFLEPCNAVALTCIIEDWNFSMLTSEFWHFCQLHVTIWDNLSIPEMTLLCE